MTNERAVEILNLDLDILGQYGGETAEAYKMAIQALEAQPCEDCISREEMLSLQTEYAEEISATTFWKLRDDIRKLPPVITQFTDEEIDKAQAVEQAYVDKMVELAVEETKRPKGKWIRVVDKAGHWVWECGCKWQQRIATNYCPDCGSYNGGNDNGDE